MKALFIGVVAAANLEQMEFAQSMSLLHKIQKKELLQTKANIELQQKSEQELLEMAKAKIDAQIQSKVIAKV